MLADRDLLELPLESLSILQEEDLSFVSRDFSLQFFYSRLNSNKTQKGNKHTCIDCQTRLAVNRLRL